MVMIGDKIKFDDGREGKILNIEKTFCDRYYITYVSHFIEGDIDFEVIE